MNDYQKKVTEIQQRFERDRKRRDFLERLEFWSFIACLILLMAYVLIRRFQ